jgi:hypothetical protein
MNAPLQPDTRVKPPLHELLLGSLAPEPEHDPGPEARWLLRCRAHGGSDPVAALTAWLQAPPSAASPLLALVSQLQLGVAELIALALACGAETDTMTGRVLAWLQAPLPSARPSVGLVCTLAETLGVQAALSQLLEGKAHHCGVLKLVDQGRPLAETALSVPLPLVLALQSQGQTWPGIDTNAPSLDALSSTCLEEATRQARALGNGAALVVRSTHPLEARTACAALARAAGRRAAFVQGSLPEGFGAWAWLTGSMPVVCAELGPGETLDLSAPRAYDGPLLVATGLEGGVRVDGDAVDSWTLETPSAAERGALWLQHTDDPLLARTLGEQHRCGSFHIRRLGRAALHQARLAGGGPLSAEHVRQASRAGVAGALDMLAQLLPETIADDALVLSSALRAELEALQQRCQLREDLAATLGPSVRARYSPSVRALLFGPSGTGKTLAAGWLASRLGLPLYRVDLATVTSKYIGETEKNLARLFANAEHGELVLLFDEADALFGKRTDVKDSNDRFANAQTNYLLQRLESFDGIALLTSNSRSRFDAAFTRRLDMIIEFPQPSPEERRRLWLAHLGQAHALDGESLNRLAANCELAGGHVRNAVLAAAVLARSKARPIRYEDIVGGIAAEYRKLGKPLPAGLVQGGARWD